MTLNLALIGGRGSGKSSCCKRIVRRNKNFTLYSLDDLIRYEADGASIPTIVRERGWAQFRELEYRVLERTCRFERSALLDCGGGIVVESTEAGEIFSDRKVELLRSSAKVVYIKRDLEYLVRRSGKDPNRPDLSDRESFEEIMRRREPWYEKAAHHVVDAHDLNKPGIATAVLSWFYAECGYENAAELADAEES